MKLALNISIYQCWIDAQHTFLASRTCDLLPPRLLGKSRGTSSMMDTTRLFESTHRHPIWRALRSRYTTLLPGSGPDRNAPVHVPKGRHHCRLQFLHSPPSQRGLRCRRQLYRDMAIRVMGNSQAIQSGVESRCVHSSEACEGLFVILCWSWFLSIKWGLLFRMGLKLRCTRRMALDDVFSAPLMNAFF